MFAPTVTGNYTFTVVVTNINGCQTTCTINICVKDIRVPGSNGKKVYICHSPPDNPANAHTLSIGVSAVADHLGNHSGDRLGKCEDHPCSTVPAITTTTATRTATTRIQWPIKENRTLTIKAWPNPEEQFFTMQVEGNNSETVNVKVFDVNGRQVYVTKGSANRNYRFGVNFVSGVYLAKVSQGDKRSLIKLVKQ
ncbi:MAG: T9SS type A sorting domain-containing protein [Chitinophagaceae bacterium]